MAKRYSRREEEEVEVAEGEATEETTNVTPEEEDTFKKRYGDLRRYMQQTVESKDKELEQLKAQLRDKQKDEFTLPTSEDEIEAWATKYPEVAKIVD